MKSATLDGQFTILHSHTINGELFFRLSEKLIYV